MRHTDVVKDGVGEWLSRNHQRVERQRGSPGGAKLASIALHSVDDDVTANISRVRRHNSRAVIDDGGLLRNANPCRIRGPREPSDQFGGVNPGTRGIKHRALGMGCLQGVLWLPPLRGVDREQGSLLQGGCSSVTVDVRSRQGGCAALNKVTVNVERGSPGAHRGHAVHHRLAHQGGGGNSVLEDQCPGAGGE